MTRSPILLVEDNPIACKMMRMEIESGAHEVIVAGEGRLALRAITVRRPGMLVVDHVLPDMDGLDLIAEIRRILQAPALPAVLLTGRSNHVDELRARAGPETQVCEKPAEPGRLLEVVRAHLNAPQLESRGRRVFYIDDEPLNRMLGSMNLKSAGFEVEPIASGPEALARSRDRPPDAILAGVLMSEMDGFAFCVAAGLEPMLEGVPIVLVSGASVDEADHELSRRVGASALVVRTPGFRNAIAAIEAGLASRRPAPQPLDAGEFTLLHGRRLRVQLERQAARNELMSRQRAIQATALSVVRGLSVVLARPSEVPEVIGNVLVHCLDATGIATGLLYLMESGAAPRLQAQFGLRSSARQEAESSFGHAEFFQRIVREGRPVAGSSIENGRQPAVSDILRQLAQPSALFMPFVVLGVGTGVLILASDRHDLSEPQWLSFARGVAAQFGQTVALGHSLMQLTASESRHRALMEQANDPILVLDTAGSVIDVNHMAERLLGRRRIEIVGRPFEELAVPEERAAAARDRVRLLEEGRLRVPLRHVSGPGGMRVPVEVSGALVHVAEATGDPVLVTHLRDITDRRIAELALQESEERARLILDSTAEAIYGIDLKGRCSFANPACLRLLGYESPYQLLGQDMHWLIHHTRADGALYAAQDCPLSLGSRAAAKVHLAEERLWRADGTSFPAEVWSHPLSRDGKVVGAVVTFLDTTERVNAEIALRKTQRRLQHVVTSGPAVLYSLRLQGGRFAVDWVSDNVERLLGYKVDEVLDPDWLPSHLHPDEREMVLGKLPALYSDGHLSIECRLLSRNAGYRRVDSEMRLLRDAAGAPVEVVGSWVDITLQRNTEQQLRDSEEQYRLLFDHHPHPMWVIHATTLGFLAVNTRGIEHYGYSREEFLALTLPEIHPPEGVGELMQSLGEREVARAGRERAIVDTLRHRRKDGSIIQAEVSRRRIRFQGEPAWLVLAVDVTEKRNLEAQLLRSQKMESVGRLAGGVAHDFNNLLGVITGYSDLLNKRLPEDERLRRYLDQIQQAANRAAVLTRQLLAFSRRQVLRPRALDLNAIVTEAGVMLGRMIGEDIRLETRLADGLPPVMADPAQLEQALMNIVVNARDAMPRGGQVVIETGCVRLDAVGGAAHLEIPRGRYVCVSVRDNGTGMPPEVLAQVFDPFFTTKPDGKGSGLGLAMVHGIVRQSGGAIEVSSEPGIGSTFTIYLPAVEEIDDPAAAAREAPRGTETVLVVEDEDALLDIIRESLEDRGYTVLSAGNADAAQSACASYEGVIHLLVTDVVLPGVGGGDLARSLTQRRPDMKVLYISGYTDDALVVHEVLTGNMPFLEKPFTPFSLARKLREILDRRT